MKLCKKTLCVVLSLLMMFSCFNLCISPITFTADAATSNSQLQTAFGKISNITNLTTGDGTLLAAADALYDWVDSNINWNASKTQALTATDTNNDYSNYSVTTYANNSIVDLNTSAKSVLGSSYNTLIDTLLPTSGVVDDSAYRTSGLQTGNYTMATSEWGYNTFQTSRLSYKITTTPTKSVNVKANLDNVLLAIKSVSDVPSEIPLDVTYTYTHSSNTKIDGNSTYEKTYTENKTRYGSSWLGYYYVTTSYTWYWLTCSWNYLTGISRTVNSKNTTASADLNAINNQFVANKYNGKSYYDMSLLEICQAFSVSEISTIVANNAVYSKLSSYSDAVLNHFFGTDSRTKITNFVNNCVYAQKVINAMPAITTMNNFIVAGYDNQNYEQMTTIYAQAAPYVSILTDYNTNDPSVFTYVSANFEGYDNFSLTAAQNFVARLKKDIELYELREIKADIDAKRELYPDAAAIALIDTDDDGNYINDNANLSALNGILAGYLATIPNYAQENINEVFTEGTSYINTFKKEVQFEVDYRGANAEYGAYYEWFIPMVYSDLTKYDTETLIGTEVEETTPNLPNAEAKSDAYDSMYSKYTALIGADTMESIFGAGDEAFKNVIDDYIARLYAVILARLEAEVSLAVGYYDTYNEVSFENFTAVKDAIGRVETNIWDYINANNPAIISSQLRTDYNRLSNILVKYNAFIASDGLADWERNHLHDDNGVFVTREPTEEDEARTEGEDYVVDEDLILQIMDKLDAFLTSNDFTTLVDIDQDPDRDILLSDFIKETVAEMLFTDEFVNMIMNIIYPALADVLEDVFAGLPATYDTGIWGIDTVALEYRTLRDIIARMSPAVGIYPNQVYSFVDGSYGTARTQLANASTWEQLRDEDGNLTLDWGINAIVPENYATTAEYLTAKKEKFLGAFAESFDAILPLVRVLIADRDDMELTSEEAGSANKSYSALGQTISFSLNGDLILNADGCAGYSDVIVPILEAIGCTGIKTYSEVYNYTTSRQFTEAIFNPIIDFVENTLAKAPVSTIAEILPNLAYAIPFEKLWDLVDMLRLKIYYTVDDSILGITVIDHASVDVNFSDFLNADAFGDDIDLSSLTGLMSSMLGSFMPDLDMNTLPILNSGEIITYANLNTNASTLRKTNKRINFEADKADVFMAVVNYLVECLGNEDFLNSMLAMLVPAEDGEEAELPAALLDIIANVRANPDLAVAALAELLVQQEYALEEYSWYEEEIGGTVEGVTPATFVYLNYNNDWTKTAADHIDENLTDIVDSVMELAGSEVDLGEEIKTLINGIFTNANITAIAKALGSINLESKINDILKSELDVDLTEFEQYAEIEDDYNWGFEDGDREAFAKTLITVIAPLSPVLGFILSGEDLTLFNDVKGNDLVTFYGNDGYDTSILPLLEALGCDAKTSAEIKAEGLDVLDVVFETFFERIDEIAADPINEILNVLPGVLYFLASDGLSTAISNLLHPVYVILDTLRPIYNIDLESMFAASEEEEEVETVAEGEEAAEENSEIVIDFENLGVELVADILSQATGLKLDTLTQLIYDVCSVIGVNYTSGSNFVAEGKKGAYTEGVFDRADMITVLLTYFIELLEDEENAAVVDELLGTENFAATLFEVFDGVEPDSKPINWMYYFGEDHDFTEYDFDLGINIVPTFYCLSYPNDWTRDSAEYVADNLDSIANSLAKLLSDEGYETLSEMLYGSFNLYTAENVQLVADTLLGIVDEIDTTLLDLAGVMLGVDFEGLAGYTADPEIDTSAEFVAALSEVLSYAGGVVDWLLFGKDYEFFTGTDVDEDGEYIYNDIITVKGANGYKNGLAVILEALGCENLPTGDEENALELILTSAVARLDEIFANPASEILDLLPNVIYFLNADGLTTSVYNTLSAVYALCETLAPLGVELNVNDIFGFDTSDLSFAMFLSLAGEETGLDLTPVIQIFLGLCVGTIKSYVSISGEYAYTMSYNNDMERKDMVTLILTAALRVIELGSNEEVLRELLGDDVYTVILNIFNYRKTDMQEIDYMYTEYADTDYSFSAIETSELYKDHVYGPLYTEDKAQYIAENFGQFVDNIVYLLGIEVNGVAVENLAELLSALVNGSLYNSTNAQAILDIFVGLSAEIEALEGGEHIKAIIKTSLGVDLDFWNEMIIPEFENDREQFTQVVCDIIAPLYPVLRWALCDEYFAFFVDEEKNDIITLLGAEGYAYGIIPVLEALGCEDVLTPDEYYAAVEADEDAILTAILNPLFNKLDVIAENPAEEILEMLPGIIYFINSNGLDTCFKNSLNAVYTLLDALEPLVEVDLYDVIGIRLDEMTFESLFDYAVEAIAESTGYELSGFTADTIAEMTTGKLVSYTSANGNPAYTMVYDSENAKVDMVTVVLRLLVTFLMTDDNVDAVLGILKDNFNMTESSEKYMRAFLETLASYAVETHHGMDSALAAIYYVFYGVDIAVDEAINIRDNKINAKWQEILKKLGKSDDPNEVTLGNFLAALLDSTLDGIIDSDGLASDGFVKFFKNIADLINKILNFFKELFNIE